VRHAAYVAVYEASLRRAFALAVARQRREWIAWQAHRVAVTSTLLDIPWREVTSAEIVWCHVEYGTPDLDDKAPKLRIDRRFGPRNPNRVR
jgi:hypothetical protein